MVLTLPPDIPYIVCLPSHSNNSNVCKHPLRNLLIMGGKRNLISWISWKKMLTSLEIRQLVKILLKPSQQHPRYPTKKLWRMNYLMNLMEAYVMDSRPQHPTSTAPSKEVAQYHSFWVCCPYFRDHLSCRAMCTPQSLPDLGASGLSHFSSVC